MQEVGENETEVTEFILIGWSGRPKARMSLMAIMITAYSITVVGNGLIVIVIISDPRLHNPMYFFLCNLSILDLFFTSSAIPQSIANCMVDRPVVSLPLCYIQLYSSLFLGSTECFLLAVMAYDRYVAISNPLRYTLIMNRTVCILLVIATWTIAFMLTVVPCLAKPARFCGNNEVDHISCELKAVIKLICSDTSSSQISMFLTSTFTLVLPLGFILFSYMRILAAILRMHSEGSRLKAFSTCGSHLVVVTMFYGTAIFAYLLPQNKNTHDIDKIFSVFYGVVTPMFNPLIYTLRNQEVLGALKRMMGKKAEG
ncbi:olfactory receptor 13H1-like [Elgaria multicarinata webbii]|uniref:olfactory receptor 13H1-like n=1 Tax=Elgaria multicarinata webbii TaxID=159646 RepID=UPI002FCCED34